MYIQITTRCNYDCEHCCFSCVHKGEDMDERTYLMAIALAVDIGDSVFIGGGEPTIHPLFIDFVQTALTNNSICDVGFWTNGSRAMVMRRIEELCSYYDKYELCPCLSNDEYHRYCNARNKPRNALAFAEIHAMFKRNGWTIRDSLSRISATGRAKDIADETHCVCSNVFVTPSGDVYPCGCMKTKIGNVNIDDREWIISELHRIVPEHYEDTLCEVHA